VLDGWKMKCVSQLYLEAGGESDDKKYGDISVCVYVCVCMFCLVPALIHSRVIDIVE